MGDLVHFQTRTTLPNYRITYDICCQNEECQRQFISPIPARRCIRCGGVAIPSEHPRTLDLGPRC